MGNMNSFAYAQLKNSELERIVHTISKSTIYPWYFFAKINAIHFLPAFQLAWNYSLLLLNNSLIIHAQRFALFSSSFKTSTNIAVELPLPFPTDIRIVCPLQELRSFWGACSPSTKIHKYTVVLSITKPV